MRLLKAMGFFKDKKEESVPAAADVALRAASAAAPPVLAPAALSPSIPAEAALSLAIAKQAATSGASNIKVPPDSNHVAGQVKTKTDVEPRGAIEQVTAPNAPPIDGLTQVRNPVGGNTLFGNNSDNTRTASAMSEPDVFTRYLATKVASLKTANAGFSDPSYYTGIGNPANLLIAGLGGYGGAQLGRTLAGVGARGNASRQLANVEQQLMGLASNSDLSARQRRRLLAELNREASIIGASRASMPNTVGQAEAASKRMSESLARKITARRIPGLRGLGIVAGAAAPFILPDFLRKAGVIA